MQINFCHLGFYNYEDEMDEEIRKIEHDTGKVKKELRHLEKTDKKRDKFVAAGKKALKKGNCR